MNLSPHFSVIIPTCNRNESLAKCLNCLAPKFQTLLAEQYEVIVTDDGSQTTAEEIIREHYPWVKWVAGPHKGPAANRNHGAKYAQREWLAFTDDDCLPSSEWLEAYAKAIVNDPCCFVFEGRTYVDRPRQSLAETSPANELGGYLWSCNFAIQKQLFESLAGFDERFPYAAMEDVDLGFRLTQMGQKFSFVKAASVCHPWRTTDDCKKLKQHQESTFIYLSLHPEESVKINSVYYLRWIWNSFIKDIWPGIIQYKGAGLGFAIKQQISNVQMVLYLAIGRRLRNKI